MRIHITLDEELVKKIDEVAGKRGRSAFIRDAAAAEAERQRKWKLLWKAVEMPGEVPEWFTAEWISNERKRDGEAQRRRMEKHWNAPGHDDSD